MYKILMRSPFGFVLELIGESVYQQQKPYRVLINGTPYLSDTKNVISVFGLSPGTEYQIEIQGLENPIGFAHKTEKAEYVLDIKDYGALGDGKTDDTCAVNAAIYTAPAGSVVRFAKGVYILGSLFLKSGVDIYLEDGAEIRQTLARENLAVLKGYQKNFDHTGAMVNATWEGNPLDSYASLIYGRDVENIRIYGAGVLNGNGEQGDWWQEPKIKKTYLKSSLNRICDSHKKIAWRPRNIFLACCKNITVAGITSRNSAAWNIHPFYSERLAFYALNIESNPVSPNTDGLNPESCADVEIVGCRFDVGDDCIAIKSGKFYMSRRHYKPSERIKVRNCLMENGHGGVVMGSEISCGVRDVEVRQCLFRATDRGLRIKTRRGRGDTSAVDGVRFTNVVMEHVADCFTINMFYNCDPDGRSDYVRCKEPLPVTDETPSVKNISVSGVTAREILGSAIFIAGLPESNVQNVKVENSTFSFLAARPVSAPEMMEDEVLIQNLGVYINNADNVIFNNNCFEGDYVSVIGNEEESHV